MGAKTSVAESVNVTSFFKSTDTHDTLDGVEVICRFTNEFGKQECLDYFESHIFCKRKVEENRFGFGPSLK